MGIALQMHCIAHLHLQCTQSVWQLQTYSINPSNIWKIFLEGIVHFTSLEVNHFWNISSITEAIHLVTSQKTGSVGG